MTEINNFQNFGIKRIETKKVGNEEKTEQPQIVQQEDRQYVQDTGVLGRSQVTYKGGDITKSVDETIALMEKNPQILTAGEELFDQMYNSLLSKGMPADEAYCKASIALEDFKEMAIAQSEAV